MVKRTSVYLDGARDLAELDYFVFPCVERGKRPLTRRGFEDASRDERELLRWWTARPAANIGVSRGASGIVVLDIDSKLGADPAEAIPALGLELDDLVLSWTGEAPEPDEAYPQSLAGVRGAHGWFRGRARTGELELVGCELRGVGAFAIAPPSVHPSGVPYQWHRRTRPPRAGRLPELPASLAASLARSGNGAGAGIHDASDELVPHGRRHLYLRDFVVRLIRAGVLNRGRVIAHLELEFERYCEPLPPPRPGYFEQLADWALRSQIADRERAAARLIAGWQDIRR